MAKMSDAAVPSLLFTETANASIGTPAAGKARLFRDTDNSLKMKDEAGAVTTIGGGTGTPTDGWVDDTAETWTYASVTTFTVATDLTAKYTPGTRLKLTQTSVKYFVVVSSSYSAPNTTVTLTGGTSYTFANAAVSLNYHSCMANPQGWPTWFTFTTSVTGFSSTSVDSGVFAVTGRVLDLIVRIVGTSNATTFGITLPIANAGPQLNAYISTVIAADNGTNALRRSRFPSTTTLAFDAGLDANDGWTASGTKTVAYVGTYQI